jgi:prepilin-type N-terminal cleavage/methylation domain-containing protein
VLANAGTWSYNDRQPGIVEAWSDKFGILIRRSVALGQSQNAEFYWDSEDVRIGTRCTHICVGAGARAFTLVELLVVISIISMLMAILLPALNGAKRQARALLSMRNEREIASALNLFAEDHEQLYPPSVATVGFGTTWGWSDVTKLIGPEKRTPRIHRAMSEYLRSYITEATMMFCPNAPQRFQYLQEAWDAGDAWDNPDTPMLADPLSGTYCFYWGYVGYLGEGPRLFRGPMTQAGYAGHSHLLVTDYFGYGHWRTPGAFASCEKLDGGEVDPETQLTSAWWKAPGDPNTSMPSVTLRAGYADGHVETYQPVDAVPMRISVNPEGVPPFPDGGPSAGLYYVPRDALR